jgi:hypothetical protein
MADITKCTSKDCPLRLKCYRHLAKDADRYQSWFEVEPKIEEKDGKFTCEYFWEMRPRETY